MKITRDGHLFTIVADNFSQAETLEALLRAIELNGPFAKGKVTVSVELEFDAPPAPKKAPAKPKAKAKAK